MSNNRRRKPSPLEPEKQDNAQFAEPSSDQSSSLNTSGHNTQSSQQSYSSNNSNPQAASSQTPGESSNISELTATEQRLMKLIERLINEHANTQEKVAKMEGVFQAWTQELEKTRTTIQQAQKTGNNPSNPELSEGAAQLQQTENKSSFGLGEAFVSRIMKEIEGGGKPTVDIQLQGLMKTSFYEDILLARAIRNNIYKKLTGQTMDDLLKPTPTGGEQPANTGQQTTTQSNPS